MVTIKPPTTFTELVEVDTLHDTAVERMDWTLSFVPGMNRFISFHSYTLGLPASSRKGVVSFDKDTLYRHHTGSPGRFYGGVIYSSYIDAVFAPRTYRTYVLSALSWISDVKKNGMSQRQLTFTHASVYNSYQYSGRIALTQKLTTRSAEGVWRFNAFRDMIKEAGVPFKQDRRLLTESIDPQKSWTLQKRFIDQWFAVRLETDNLSENSVSLSDINAALRESAR